MKPPARATRIALLDFHSPPMRAFHMAWGAFFLCFFAWFGLAPLMPVVREELGLTPSQVGWSIIASVAMTMVARPVVGWLCDQFGPRRTYTALLVFCSLPVMGVGFAHSFATFLVFRLLIGIVGASFVITQYHTSVMFAPQCVGTANATTALHANYQTTLLHNDLEKSASWQTGSLLPRVLLFSNPAHSSAAVSSLSCET